MITISPAQETSRVGGLPLSFSVRTFGGGSRSGAGRAGGQPPWAGGCWFCEWAAYCEQIFDLLGRTEADVQKQPGAPGPETQPRRREALGASQSPWDNLPLDTQPPKRKCAQKRAVGPGELGRWH